MSTIGDTLRAAFGRPRSHDIVRDYLDRSVSMADLERREREIDAGKFRRWPSRF